MPLASDTRSLASERSSEQSVSASRSSRPSWTALPPCATFRPHFPSLALRCGVDSFLPTTTTCAQNIIVANRLRTYHFEKYLFFSLCFFSLRSSFLAEFFFSSRLELFHCLREGRFSSAFSYRNRQALSGRRRYQASWLILHRYAFRDF